MTFKVIEHQDFYEVEQDGLSVLVADRHHNALIFLNAAVEALNARPVNSQHQIYASRW